MKQKLLVTGTSGFLGWNLAQQAAAQWDVYGTFFSHPVIIPGVKLFKIDLRDFDALKRLFAQLRPAGVIHTAAQSQPNFCQNYPDEAYAVNVTATLNLAQLCAERAIPFVFTSTDLVFDGTDPPYRETDPVSPINRYGEQKAEAEQGILGYPHTTVCRMPLLFGEAPPMASSFIQPFIKTLRSGQELRLFTDEWRTPVSASSAAAGLLLALQVPGLLHLGGKERVSRYQFGCLMAEVLQLPQDKLLPCLQKAVPMAAPRPTDVSLDSSKAFDLGYQPLRLREALAAL